MISWFRAKVVQRQLNVLPVYFYKTEEEYIGKLFMYKINRVLYYTQKLDVFTCFF